MAQWLGLLTSDPRVWGSGTWHDQTFIQSFGSHKFSVIQDVEESQGEGTLIRRTWTLLNNKITFFASIAFHDLNGL